MSSAAPPPGSINLPHFEPTSDGGVTGAAVPAGSTVVVQDAPVLPRDLSLPPDHFVWRYAVSMVMELHNGAWQLSIGRTMLLSLFIHCLVLWSTARDIHDHEMDALWALLAYVLGSKITGVIQQWRK